MNEQDRELIDTALDHELMTMVDAEDPEAAKWVYQAMKFMMAINCICQKSSPQETAKEILDIWADEPKWREQFYPEINFICHKSQTGAQRAMEIINVVWPGMLDQLNEALACREEIYEEKLARLLLRP